MTSHRPALSVLRTKPRRCGCQVYCTGAPSASPTSRAMAFSSPSCFWFENGMLFGSAQTRRGGAAASRPTSASRAVTSVPAGGRLLADLLAVAPGVLAQRVREDRGTVRLRVPDVVGQRPLGRVQASLVAHPLGHLVIGAGGVAAGPQAAHAGLPLVKRHTAPEDDGAAAQLRPTARPVR